MSFIDKGPIDPNIQLPENVRKYLENESVLRDELFEKSVKSKMESVRDLFQLYGSGEVSEISKAVTKERLPGLENFDFSYYVLSDEEKSALEQLLRPNGKLEALLNLDEHVKGKISQLKGKDLILSNGKTLTWVEQALILLYTDCHYLLINGTLDQDATSLNLWEKMRFPKGTPPTSEEKSSIFREAQDLVPLLAKGLASSLSKLPDEDEILYRGDAIPSDELESWRKGKTLQTSKFFSCSTLINSGEYYARSSARDYINDTRRAYTPVLYVFYSLSGKDINPYSAIPGENERTFPPYKLYQSIDVDEETVPGLAIIFMEEIN